MVRNLFAMALVLISMSKCRLDGAMGPAEPHAPMLRAPIETISALCSYQIPQASTLSGRLSTLLILLKVHQVTAAPKNPKRTQGGPVRRSFTASPATGTSAEPVQVDADIPEGAVVTSSATGSHPVAAPETHVGTHESTVATVEHASTAASAQTPPFSLMWEGVVAQNRRHQHASSDPSHPRCSTRARHTRTRHPPASHTRECRPRDRLVRDRRLGACRPRAYCSRANQTRALHTHTRQKRARRPPARQTRDRLTRAPCPS